MRVLLFYPLQREDGSHEAEELLMGELGTQCTLTLLRSALVVLLPITLGARARAQIH